MAATAQSGTVRGIPPQAHTSGRIKAGDPVTTSIPGRSTSLSIVGDRYRVGRKIGEGSFGIIYEGICFLYVVMVVFVFS